MKNYPLKDPFIDIGCGRGDVSEFFAVRGWRGKAIDSSTNAILATRERLKSQSSVSISCSSLEEEVGSYSTAIMLDCLEHCENDDACIKKVHSLLVPTGYAILSVPSNPQEWRWDDDYYGHYRRYTATQITELLNNNGFDAVELWDFTYPFFWAMRRIYTRFFHRSLPSISSSKRSADSSLQSAWSSIPWNTNMQKILWVWRPIYWIQFSFFRNALNYGHEFIILAKKRSEQRYRGADHSPGV